MPRLHIASLICLLIVSCSGPGPQPPVSGAGSGFGSSPSSDPSSSSGSSSDGYYFSLPSQPGRVPPDIIQHISYEGVGGPEGMACLCLGREKGVINLEQFPANSSYRIVIYSTFTSNGVRQGTYLTHFTVKTDASGKATISIPEFNPDIHDAFSVESDGKLMGAPGVFDASLFYREPPTPTLSTSQSACSLSNRFSTGQTAMVSLQPPLPNNVRSMPDRNSIYLGEIKPGEKVTIIGGPECGNGWSWWKVQSQSTGLQGWTREGDSNDYWLVKP